jgi:hypothetical protein
LFRNGGGRIALSALPIQFLGLAWVVAAIPMIVGVVPTDQAPRLAVAVLVGGTFLMTLATMLMRLMVWFRDRARAD